MAAGTTVKLVLPSMVRLVDLVHSTAEAMAMLAGLDADEALNVGLAVREAAINAIVHGNERNPKLKVTVTLTVRANTMEARVRDQGSGFDPEATADPLSEDRLLETSGRGLLLIGAFVDRVRFRRPQHGGMEIILTKKLSEDAK